MYHNRSGRHSRIAWPRIVASSARYMGLRTCRYRPPTTRCTGGATGAGVPSPSTTNRANADTSTAVPATTSTAPSTRRGRRWDSGAPGCQSVISHGTSPAMVPGARAKKTALPVAAALLRMAPRYRSRTGVGSAQCAGCEAWSDGLPPGWSESSGWSGVRPNDPISTGSFRIILARPRARFTLNVSQKCHAFADPQGHGGRTPEGTTADEIESTRPLGKHRDTRGHELRRVGTVRPRAQIPGPRPASECVVGSSIRDTTGLFTDSST